MKTIDPDSLLAAIAEALETMAFIAVEPAGEPEPLADQLQISLPFVGKVRGQLTLIAPTALGTAIAANLAAVEVDSISLDQARDALRELTNVTAGLLLRQICLPDEMPQLSIPIVSVASDVISDCRTSLSADGHFVTLSLRTGA